MKNQPYNDDRRNKKPNIIVLLFLFIFISFIYINPETKREEQSYHSSQLHKSITREGNNERTDYTDAEGRLTDAADLGYSTVIVSRNGKSAEEKYYDHQGNQVYRKYSGHYILYLEYDDNDRITVVSYRDIDGNPVIIADGYSKETRDYHDNTVTIKYFDTMDRPIRTASYGYERVNEYDENGKIIKITCIDAAGEPMMTRQGYAIIRREYYHTSGPEDGKLKNEYYFDQNGKPVALSLGQYGVCKGYDESGRENALTYLDADGNPTVTNKGYSTIVRSYDASNRTATEQYYDSEGKPFALSEGQYGFKKENGQTIYLDQNGQEEFNLKNLLYNHSWIAIPLSLTVILFSMMLNKKYNMLLLVMCVIIILYFTLLFRYGGAVKRAGFFWCYRRFFTNSEARADIFRNIWLFVPLGAILYRLFPKRIILLVPLAFSMMIEIIQYFSGTGFCEFDDIISNGLGGVIGYSFEKVFSHLCRRISISREKKIYPGRET